MSDTRNHTTRDQLAAHFIAGVDHPRQGTGQTIPSPVVCCLTCGWMSAGDYEEHLVAAVRAAAVAETTATIEALADKWESETEPYLPGGRRYEASGDTLRARADCRRLDAEHLRGALSGGRTALDTTLAQARADALREYANLATERANHLAPPRFKSTADGRERNVWNLVAHELNNRADTGADQ